MVGRSRLRRGAVAAFGAAIALATLLSACGSSADPGKDRPNVVLIISDDQRDNTFGLMERTREDIAERGIYYPNGVVTTPLCCPSRVSIMTGQYVHNHGVRFNKDAPGAPENEMLARELSDAGYYTGLYGKYFNNWPPDKPPANYDAYHVGYGPAGGYEGTGRGRDRADDWLGRRAERFISEREDDDERPFFLVLSARSPHNPYRVAKRYRETHVPRPRRPSSFNERDLSDKPRQADLKASKTRKAFDKRGGFREVVDSIVERQEKLLLSLDDMVGTTLDALDSAGETEDTLVIYISDNGVFWGEHGFVQKTRAYPETVEVPFAISWPRHVEAGTVDPRVAANIDIAPTIYDAARIDPDHEVDGRSLLRPNPRDWAFVEKWTGGGRVRGILVPGREQYLENRSKGGHLKSREYYDLVEDPDELDNLIGTPAEPAERVAQLARMTQSAAACAGRDCP